MKIVLTGGGTGGHVYPALAFMRECKKEYPDAEFLYIGTGKGLEADIVPRAGLEFEAVDVTGFKRSLSLENVKTIARFLKGVTRSKKILRDFKPDCVIGTGGYVCGPVVYAAHKLKIPTIIHEQNSVAGLTNKFLSRYVDKVAICFEEVSESFPSEKIVFTGNPRASEVVGIKSENALAEYHLDDSKKTVLAFGGSRGARAINEAIWKILPEWNKKDYQLLYVTGDVHYEKIKDELESLHLNQTISVVPFIYNMPEVLNEVDLVISRAGATTLSELTSLGLPSILIPSPYVTANHQENNARSLERNGASIVITEKELGETDLMQKVDGIMSDEMALNEMAFHAKEIGVPDAAKRLVDVAVNLMKP
ncbi:undecaprenyldiphospho-muramoylpentapeptide beta-N- acetylglucosaminyltransferase [Listeria floridensis FSL S10-1187]|uniref:UDP-N-acetylglucosamine--N-acetylmuramyl-(pentapeptide) pyrophosphoryl-undecaprenol N-acetylglucosamine transferase n=1 Tax=Listeria floridensis FSL S10-1187 TaxID=1265817 RepID=A0ABP3B0I5_9LIST|nr:undecaprenyldiphospho-muramoylpentapeptide beta-N-acetylglucosaminyltransferase [Listeria floridensis]EUJ32078.1 undecaprenyldiphospho-muramoylpentapeptide beta-N- acetylglucosaminyltransferase [Listeria floridensis FSL S10-1187]